MRAGRQKIGRILVGKLFFTGRLNNMALPQAIDFLGRLMRNLLDIRMTPFAFDFGMHAFIENIFIDVQEPEFTFLVNPTETGIFMAQKAVADVGRRCVFQCKNGEQCETYPAENNEWQEKNG